LGETLFVGTDSGILLSQDEARSWRPSTDMSVARRRVISFAALDAKVIAGTDGSGLLVSPDNGKSWALHPAFPSKKVRCLVAYRGSLYAGTDADGVFVSRDGGQAWAQLQGLPPQVQVFALSVVEGRLFAGLYSKGLYAWNEQERRWTKVAGVSPLVLATAGGTLIAGHNPGGLYWSADLGASWSKATAKTVESFTSLQASEPGELSSDAPVWEAAANDELVFAGASAGIYYSEDRGRTWTRARAGLPTESPGVSFLLEPNFVLAATVIKNANGQPDGAAKPPVR
jgi:photosystem II stability/assembly factor-like uncharacterized protein